MTYTEHWVYPQTGFVVDFFEIDSRFAPILEQLDQSDLNHLMPNPTAEHIAIWIWRQIAEVRVYETPYCWAEYNGW